MTKLPSFLSGMFPSSSPSGLPHTGPHFSVLVWRNMLRNEVSQILRSLYLKEAGICGRFGSWCLSPGTQTLARIGHDRRSQHKVVISWKSDLGIRFVQLRVHTLQSSIYPDVRMCSILYSSLTHMATLPGKRAGTGKPPGRTNERTVTQVAQVAYVTHSPCRRTRLFHRRCAVSQREA